MQSVGGNVSRKYNTFLNNEPVSCLGDDARQSRDNSRWPKILVQDEGCWRWTLVPWIAEVMTFRVEGVPGSL